MHLESLSGAERSGLPSIGLDVFVSPPEKRFELSSVTSTRESPPVGLLEACRIPAGRVVVYGRIRSASLWPWHERSAEDPHAGELTSRPDECDGTSKPSSVPSAHRPVDPTSSVRRSSSFRLTEGDRIPGPFDCLRA